MNDFIEMKKVVNDINRLWDKICKTTVRGARWFGYDGLVNLETAAILYLFMVLFMSVPMAGLVTMCVALVKCAYDSNHGHVDEMHDMLCAGIGIVVGIILSLAFGVTI